MAADTKKIKEKEKRRVSSRKHDSLSHREINFQSHEKHDYTRGYSDFHAPEPW